jgi:tetratricopeptide (TPR) repeat protein
MSKTSAERALAILTPIWNNIEQPPDIAGLDGELACEILIVCGSVISAHGTINQKKHYKELAVNMLTNARELAIGIENRELIAESEKQIAVAYWRHGEFENAIAYSNTVLSKYSESEQLTDRICLLTQANLLMLYVSVDRYDAAFEIFKKIKPFVDESEDFWLKTVFYNQASGIFVSAGKFELAVPLLEKTIEYATCTKNNCYLGNALNNLANAYVQLSETDKAIYLIDEAIELFRSLQQEYPYALALETKAQLGIKQEKLDQALVDIDESIAILRKGENYAELCESMWTRTVILVKSGEKKSALRQFSALMQVIENNLHLALQDSYIDKFNNLLFIDSGRNFYEKTENYRLHLLEEALRETQGMVTKAAEYLGISHQNTSVLLKKYPEICEKHNVKLRKRSTDSILPTAGKIKKTSENSFAMRILDDRLEYLGISIGKIVIVERKPIEKLDLSKPVVIQDKQKKYHCGFLVDAFEMFAFEDGRGNLECTYLSSEISDCGQVVSVRDPESDNLTSFENIND